MEHILHVLLFSFPFLGLCPRLSSERQRARLSALLWNTDYIKRHQPFPLLSEVTPLGGSASRLPTGTTAPAGDTVSCVCPSTNLCIRSEGVCLGAGWISHMGRSYRLSSENHKSHGSWLVQYTDTIILTRFAIKRPMWKEKDYGPEPFPIFLPSD